MKRKFLIKLSLIFIIALAGAVFFQWEKTELLSIKGGSIVSLELSRDFSVRGLLSPVGGTPILAPIQGRILRINAHGAEVKKGELLLEVDDTQVKNWLDKIEEKIEDAKTDLEESISYQKLIKELHTEDLRKLKANLDYEQEKLNQLLEKPDSAELEKLELELELAKLDEGEKLKELNRQNILSEKDFVALTIVESAQRDYLLSKSKTREGKLALEIAKLGANKEEVIELKRSVERSQARLKRAEKEKEREQSRYVFLIEGTKQNIKAMELERDDLLEMQKKTQVLAEQNGVMNVFRHRERGGMKKEFYSEGQELNANDQVGEIMQPTQMEVVLRLNEADYAKVSLGLKARVRLPALSNTQLVGKVLNLGAIGQDRSKVDPLASLDEAANVSVYAMRIGLDVPVGVNLSPGMSAEVDLELEEKKQRLVVERQFVKASSEDGIYLVLLKNKKAKTEEKKFKGRILNEQWFELENGDALK